MAITYPLSVPTVKLPMALEFGPTSAVGMSSSPFTFETQTQVHQGKVWVARATYPILSQTDGNLWKGFFLGLNGREGTFLFGDDAQQTALGSAGATPGTPLVDGGGQTGNVLVIKGATSGAAGYLLAGDYFSLGAGLSTRLHSVINAVNTDSAGAATLDIWPSLNTSPSDNDALDLTAPKGLFQLVSNEQNWAIQLAKLYNITLECVSIA